MTKTTARQIQLLKGRRKITALTAYDYPTAKIVDESGIDIVLMGDSLAMVLLGYASTVSVTSREMLHHLRAVRRGVKRSLLVVDMPAGTYNTPQEALRTAKTFMHEGAEAVKLEGGFAMVKQVKALTDAGIPVMGHLGMLPQSVSKLGGYKVQGRLPAEGKRMMEEAQALVHAGVFSIVLELVPRKLAKTITDHIRVPTIGIGAGPATDGQVLVLHDMLGFESSVRPRFVRRYASLDKTIRAAIAKYKQDVLKKKFPSIKESFD